MLKNPENILFIFLGVLIGLLLTENHKLEQKLLKLYDEQAELTKKIAELNGIGG